MPNFQKFSLPPDFKPPVEPKKRSSKSRELRAYWTQQLSTFKGSELTLKEFCQQHSLDYDRAKQWRQQLRKESEQAAPLPSGKGGAPVFVPVEIEGAPAISAACSSQQGIELHYPPYRLRIPEKTDVGFVRSLLLALREPPC